MDIRTLCLGILTMGDATGYEIKKFFEERLSHFYEASFGSIYPALGKMTDDGWVRCSAQAQDGRPDKKVYTITPSGRMAFLDALGKDPRKDRIRSEFLAMMMFSDLMSTARVSSLIDTRIADLQSKLDEMDACAADATTPVDQFILGFGQAVYRAEMNYLQDNRHLVEAQALMSGRAAE
ncbi:MAG: PadR family transcriptional regulator [Pseudomonadota bacterium]|nr:PadR family transcriptional regulator [Pseudomonadota bacterium]